MSQNNKAVLENANAYIIKGDIEGFLAFCSDDTEWTFVGDKTLKGKNAVREYMQATYIEPPRFSVQKLIEGDDHVTAIGDIILKDEAGKDVQYAYCDVWRFRDGKMVELMAFVINADIKN